MRQSVVNLLLFFSALLSALTGIGPAVRMPASAHAAAGVVASVRAEVRAARVASRPQEGVPPLARLAAALCNAATIALTPAHPLYASRRRE